MEGIQFNEALSYKGRYNREKWWSIMILVGGFFYIFNKVLKPFVESMVETQLTLALLSSIGLAVISIFMLILGVFANIKRLHDLNKSGVFCIFNLIPIVNLGMLIWLGFIKGTPGINNYGENPLEKKLQQTELQKNSIPEEKNTSV